MTHKSEMPAKDNVVEYSDVRDKVCELLGIKDLREERLGWDFWWAWGQHADDCINSGKASECEMFIDGMLERFANDDKATKVLKAFKQVLGY